MREFNPCWPPELLEADRLNYRAECKLRCLTACLDRTEPEDFEQVMDQIEAAKRAVFETGMTLTELRYRYNQGVTAEARANRE